jgi:hypothetical protein
MPEYLETTKEIAVCRGHSVRIVVCGILAIHGVTAKRRVPIRSAGTKELAWGILRFIKKALRATQLAPVAATTRFWLSTTSSHAEA